MARGEEHCASQRHCRALCSLSAVFDGLEPMTSDDVDRIEGELEIKLPESYRQVVLAYPIPAFSGNAETKVWDNAKRIIEHNKELRAGAPGGVKPWPKNMFATGHGGDGCPTAIDLDDGDAVWWVDHSHLDNPGSYKEAESFGKWAESYFAQLRQDLEYDDIDPDGTPDERAIKEAPDSRYFYGCAIVAIVAFSVFLLGGLLGWF